MKDKRAFTAGIVYDNVFHIFGGYDGSRLKTSEVVSESGITYDSLYNQNHLILQGIMYIQGYYKVFIFNLSTFLISDVFWAFPFENEKETLFNSLTYKYSKP